MKRKKKKIYSNNDKYNENTFFKLFGSINKNKFLIAESFDKRFRTCICLTATTKDKSISSNHTINYAIIVHQDCSEHLV